MVDEHVQASRLRWLARALRAAGEVATADAHVAELAGRASGHEPSKAFGEQLALARVDAAVAAGGDVGAACLALSTEEARRTLARVAGEHPVDLEIARRVADEFRY